MSKYAYLLSMGAINIPPPPVVRLVQNGLYGSWRLNEGSGSVANSEGGLNHPLTFGADSGTVFPTWKPGGGVVFPGPATWLRRLSEAAMDTTDGATITLAIVPNIASGQKNLFQRYSGNLGFNISINKTTNKLSTSMGLGASRSAAAFTGFTNGTPITFTLSIPKSGKAIVNVNGTTPTFTPDTFPWADATTANLFLGYQYVGDIHYAAYHTRALDAQECADMVAYATSILQARGVIT